MKGGLEDKRWEISNHEKKLIEKQKELDKKYMKMAYIWAENSYAKKRKVGCLIVKDNQILSDGYNGCPSGMPNICEEEQHIDTKRCTYCEKEHCEGCDNIKLVTLPYVLHAEANAITKLAKSTNSSVGATLYVTTSPCLSCSKLIIQSGIKRVVYCEEYHDITGIDLLKKLNIEVVRINI